MEVAELLTEVGDLNKLLNYIDLAGGELLELCDCVSVPRICKLAQVGLHQNVRRNPCAEPVTTSNELAQCCLLVTLHVYVNGQLDHRSESYLPALVAEVFKINGLEELKFDLVLRES